MKKLTLMLLALIMVTSAIPMSALAIGGEENIPTLIFDMDLSTSSVDALSIRDKSGSGLVDNTNVTYGRAANNNPIYKVNEQGTPYLTFSYLDGTEEMNKESQVNFVVNDKAFGNRDKLTFSTWIREVYASTRKNKPFFALGAGIGGSPGYEAFNASYVNDGVELRVYPDRTYGTAANDSTNSGKNLNFTSMAEHTGKWTHVVITREWIANDAANKFGAGTWRSTLYVNGVKIDTKELSMTERTDYTKVVASSTSSTQRVYDKLVIGGNACTDNNRAFPGDIATFKIYDGIVEEAQVAAEYDADLSKFRDLVDIVAEGGHNLSDADAESHFVKFDGALSPDTDITKLKIKDSAGKVLKTTNTYDKETYTATIVLNDRLDYGEKYILDMSEIKGANKERLANPTVEFTTLVPAGALFAVPAVVKTSSKVEVALNITDPAPIPGAAKTFYLDMIVCGADGKHVDMVTSKEIASAGGEASLAISTEAISGYTLRTGDKVKAIAWYEDEQKGAVAVSTPVEITVE